MMRLARLVGEDSLLRALSEFVGHYHLERPHQGLGNQRIDRSSTPPFGKVEVRKRLGGLLKHYHRRAG